MSIAERLTKEDGDYVLRLTAQEMDAFRMGVAPSVWATAKAAVQTRPAPKNAVAYYEGIWICSADPEKDRDYARERAIRFIEKQIEDYLRIYGG